MIFPQGKKCILFYFFCSHTFYFFCSHTLISVAVHFYTMTAIRANIICFPFIIHFCPFCTHFDALFCSFRARYAPLSPPAAPLFLCTVLYLYVIPRPLRILSFVIPSPLCIPPFVIPNHQGAFFQSAPVCVRDPLAWGNPRGDYRREGRVIRRTPRDSIGMTVGEGDGNKG